MVPRAGRTHATHTKRRHRVKARLGPSVSDLVIVSRALAELAEFLEPRQESAGRGRVVLDRRLRERRRAAQGVQADRRQGDRRQLPTNSTEALMRVLGFTVVPTDGTRAGSASRRGGKRVVRSTRAPDHSQRRASRATPGHRARRGRS